MNNITHHDIKILMTSGNFHVVTMTVRDYKELLAIIKDESEKVVWIGGSLTLVIKYIEAVKIMNTHRKEV